MKPQTKAKQIHTALTKIAKEFEYSDLPLLKGNEISWDGGPYQWAASALGGESIFCGELGDYSLSPEKPIQKVLKIDYHKDGVEVEAVNSYTLGVY